MTVRRVAGAALLVLAVLGSLVIAGLNGVRIAGTAIAPPGLSAPAVGACLVKLNDINIADPAIGRPADQPVTGVGEDAVQFARCGPAGQLGEVVGYQQYPRQSSATATDIGWCQRVSDDYRAHENYRFKAASAGLWEPSTGQRFLTVLSRPDADQQEPRWAACVVLAPSVETYTGSFLRSLADAPAPSPFGLCLAGSAAQRWVSCEAAHQTQEFGAGTGEPMTARAAVAACESLISQMTGLPDVTAGGLLRIEVVGGSPAGTDPAAQDGVPPVRGSADGPPGSASCRLSIIGEQRLVGTLIGIGARSLPLG